jgi:hypothetical protein
MEERGSMHRCFCRHHLVHLTVGFVCILLCICGGILLTAKPAFANLVFLHDDASLFGNHTSDIEREASLLPYSVAIYTSYDSYENPTNLAQQAQQDANRLTSKTIWIEIASPSNTIAITSDKSVPLSGADYQAAQDAFSLTLSPELQVAAKEWSSSPPYWCTSLLTPPVGESSETATAVAFECDPSRYTVQDNAYATAYTDAVKAAIDNLGTRLGVDMSFTQGTLNTQDTQPSSNSFNCISGFVFIVLMIFAFFILRSLLSKRRQGVPQVYTPLANRWEAARAAPLFRGSVFSEASRSDKDSEK